MSRTVRIKAGVGIELLSEDGVASTPAAAQRSRLEEVARVLGVDPDDPKAVRELFEELFLSPEEYGQRIAKRREERRREAATSLLLTPRERAKCKALGIAPEAYYATKTRTTRAKRTR